MKNGARGGRTAKRICKTKHCRNEVRKRCKSPYCSKCKNRIWRERNPHAYFLLRLRGNAKRRGKDFSLTLEEFKRFCDETGYLELRGRRSGCMTIDRINRNEGYHFDNIQIMENGDNVRKEHVAYFRDQVTEIL